MSAYQQIESAPGNQDAGSAACGHCAGSITHSTWCIARNSIVSSAFSIVLDGHQLKVHNRHVMKAPRWSSRSPYRQLGLRSTSGRRSSVSLTVLLTRRAEPQ